MQIIFLAGKIAHFYFTHKEINNTISFQPSDCNWSHFLHFVLFTLVMNKKKKIMNQIAYFSLTNIKKLCNHRDQPWQVRYQVKAHIPGKVEIMFLRPYDQ